MCLIPDLKDRFSLSLFKFSTGILITEDRVARETGTFVLYKLYGQFCGVGRLGREMNSWGSRHDTLCAKFGGGWGVEESSGRRARKLVHPGSSQSPSVFPGEEAPLTRNCCELLQNNSLPYTGYLSTASNLKSPGVIFTGSMS